MPSIPSRNEDESPAVTACRELLAMCDRAQVQYCVLRVDEAFADGTGRSEIDLLVDPERFVSFRRLALEAGFEPERAWGHAPHSFFSYVDGASGPSLTLDVVTDLRYGRPIRAVRYGSPAQVLARRQPTAFGYGLAAEDEFRHLLLHCALDKGEITPRHWQRLQSLATSIGTDPDLAHQLVRDQRALFWILFRAEPIASAGRVIAGIVSRRLAPALHAMSGRGLVVAVLGPDGAGKSTLAHELARSSRRARCVYMGYGGHDTHRNVFASFFFRHARSANGERERGVRRIASGVMRFAARCVVQYYRALEIRLHRRLGRLVILDRHVAAADDTGGRLARVRRRIIGALCPTPDLVIVLDAPSHVLHRRRPQHSIEELEAGRASCRQLWEARSGALVMDASQSADRLRCEVAARLSALRRPVAQPRSA